MTTRHLHGLTLAHSIPGRMRVKYHKVRTHPHLAQDLCQKLTSIAGVRRADVNQTTGSVIVHYEPSLSRSMEFLRSLVSAFELAAGDIDPMEIEEWFEVLETSYPELTLTLQGLSEGIGGRGLKWTIPALLISLGIHSLIVSEALGAPKWYEFF